MNQQIAEKEAEKQIKQEKLNVSYLKLCEAADAIVSVAPDDPSQLNLTQLKVVLKPLKQKSNPPLP